MTASPVPLSDDAAAQRLSALHAECFDEAWDAPAIARLLSMPGAFAYWTAVSAETGESPDGFVLARVGGGEAEILTICVRPAARTAGLGRVLLAAAAAHAAAAGAGSLFLEVAEDNMPALRLYESFGFSLVGTRPGYYERGSSRVAARTLKLDLPRDASPVINP